MNHKPHFIEQLEAGQPQKLAVFGTSLSFHLAPILREALQKRFGEQVEVVNAGLSGKASRTALQMLETKVLRVAPDALLTEWAINDAHSFFHEPQALDAGISLKESRDNLETLVERVRIALPECEILLMTTNPTFDSPSGSAQGATARPQLREFYGGVRELASARGLRLIDAENFWNSLLVRDEPLFRSLVPDGVHPTPVALRECLVPFIEEQWEIQLKQP